MVYKILIHTPIDDSFIPHIGINRFSFTLGTYKNKTEALKWANRCMKNCKEFASSNISYELIVE